jgi:hypothetical protein
MTLAIVLVLASAAALVLVLSISARSALQLSRTDPSNQIQPIDLEAFRNLSDAAQEDYLRHRLSPPDYRRVRRLRLKAMAAYVQIAGHNAAVLIHIGQLALQDSDPETSAAASVLVNEALLLRRNVAFALLRIYVAWTLPDANFAPASLLDGYQRLSGSAMLLGRLQNPAASVRIAAS